MANPRLPWKPTDSPLLLAIRDAYRAAGEPGCEPLARSAKVSNYTVWKLLKRDASPQIRSLDKIVRALGYEVRLVPLSDPGVSSPEAGG